MADNNNDDRAERFLATLRENGNNITAAGRTLGMSRRSARRLAEKLGVQPSPRSIANIGRNSKPPPPREKHARDEELKEKIPALLLELRTIEKVAMALHVRETTVTRIMRDSGFVKPDTPRQATPHPRKAQPRPKFARDGEILEKLPTLLAEHRSQAKVAKVLRCSPSAVRRVMQENKIPLPEPIKPEPKPKAAPPPKPDKYADIRHRLPELLRQHGSQNAMAKALKLDKKTVARLVLETGTKPPPPKRVVGPSHKKKVRPNNGSTPFNGSTYYHFGSRETDGKRVVVEYCPDPKLEQARALLLKGEEEWDVHQKVGVPLRDVYRLRFENRERAKGRM